VDKNERGNTMMLAVTYWLASTVDWSQDGRWRNSVEDYCAQKGYEVAGNYEDTVTPAGSSEIRTGFMQMLMDAQQHKFDTVIVQTVSHLSGTTRGLLRLCDELKDMYGVHVESVAEDFDSRRPVDAKIRANLVNAIGARRSSVGLVERARNGKTMCTVVLGYDHARGSGLVVNEKEAETVREMYQLYLELEDASSVCKVINESGIRGKRGGRIRTHHLRDTLTNPVYCGYGRTYHGWYKCDHEPIISVDTFNAVQTKMIFRKDTTPRRDIYPIQTID
jgi:site-specific DNA recombinase